MALRTVRTGSGTDAPGRLKPTSLEQARERLATVMRRQVARLQHIRAERVRIAELDAADLPARLAFQPGPEADRQRRYVLSRDRHLIRTIDEFLKVRTKANDGAFDQADLRADSLRRYPLSPPGRGWPKAG